MLCLTGALALATTSCKDEKVTTMQTITVNGRICEVNLLLIIKVLQRINFLSTRSWEFVDKKLTSCRQTPNFL